jgi:hypothetical protein
MAVNTPQHHSRKCKPTYAVRNRVTTAVAAAYLLIYAAALFGWLAPLADGRWVARAEPVLILAIGYYLGRLPARRMEVTFGEALTRQAQKAEAAQRAKELAQQAGEVLEERMKNAKIILDAARPAKTRCANRSPRP